MIPVHYCWSNGCAPLCCWWLCCPGVPSGVFAGGTYDEDDKEADRVWESIDNFMDERRRVGCITELQHQLLPGATGRQYGSSMSS